MNQGLRTLVVGAGVAGLAAGRALRRAGFAPELVERAPAWAGPGTGVYLPGNAARALRALDVEREVVQRAVAIPRQRFCDARGRLVFEVDVARLWRDAGPCLALPHGELHAALLGGAGPVRMGAPLRELAQAAEGVSVTLGDGTRREYDLVIGADGIGSSVRRLAFGAAVGARPVGQIGWRFVCACPPEVTTWSLMLGRRSAVLAMPIGDGRAYCYCDLVGGDRSAEQLRRLLSEFGGPAPALLDALADPPADVHVSPIEEVGLDTWVRGRVVLIGDAAHATSPNMAQGAAMALEDALVLADALREHSTVTHALATFEARRRPRTDWVRAQTHRRDRTRSLPPAVRDRVLRAFGPRIFRANYRPLLEPPDGDRRPG